MTTTTAQQTADRRTLPRRVHCHRCGDTGVIERMEPRYIGHGMHGEKVYSACHTVLARYVCACRRGWNQRIGADA
jgi:hypothetical protein